MKDRKGSPIEKFVARQIFLKAYFLLNAEEIRLRARLGNPGARQVLQLDRRFRDKPTARLHEDLYIAIAEYRRALLN